MPTKSGSKPIAIDKSTLEELRETRTMMEGARWIADDHESLAITLPGGVVEGGIQVDADPSGRKMQAVFAATRDAQMRFLLVALW